MYTMNAPRPIPGREHIPVYPKGFIAIRIAQLVVALIIMGLAAYGGCSVAVIGDEQEKNNTCQLIGSGISETPFDGNSFILVAVSSSQPFSLSREHEATYTTG